MRNCILRLCLFCIAIALIFVSAAAISVLWTASHANKSPKTADAIVVLGAAVYDDEPSPVFAARINEATRLYRDGAAVRIICTGGRSPEDTLTEGEVCRNLLAQAQVPLSVILVEDRSTSTEENLRFARAFISVFENDAPRIIIVSDPLHLARAQYIAQNEGLATQVVAAQNTEYKSLSTKLPFFFKETYYLIKYAVTRPW